MTIAHMDDGKVALVGDTEEMLIVLGHARAHIISANNRNQYPNLRGLLTSRMKRFNLAIDQLVETPEKGVPK